VSVETGGPGAGVSLVATVSAAAAMSMDVVSGKEADVEGTGFMHRKFPSLATSLTFCN
jgi:hypothetical protein